MSHLTRRRAVHALLILLCLPTATACHSWQRYELAPAPAVDSASSRTLRITRRDGSQVTLNNARLRNDTLHAWLSTAPRGGSSGQVAVAMADISSVQARKFSGGRTFGLIAGSFAAVVLTALAAAIGSTGDFLSGPSGT